ncbi:CDP-glycerol glycerophosphotransferase family protein [Selenomonas ruminantium]|uniref:CDP-glycerol glycerophosphotransferase family protein n=1 Tax=Selenomonas ruminantium TaxID=971 RepID=UPI000417E7E7|nr:CDP-glycerol glycerophosphotransferase family protein [Selenomonas ruminantium]
MIYRLINKLSAPVINALVMVLNLFIRRDNHIVLFGAWMGMNFADNTRNLFQYLHNHGHEYGFHKVIWVTRKQSICDELTNMGYECYMMYDIRSIYYHIKAGYHINCNCNYSSGKYAGDFIGHLSAGAKKYNLWHGIPLKAGSDVKFRRKDNIVKKIYNKFSYSKFFKSLFTQGQWDKVLYASSGRLCTERCSIFHGREKSSYIECGFPRNLPVPKMTCKEQIILDTIEKFDHVIIYLPTFRDNGSYEHPLMNDMLKDYIVENDILWIEKEHSAEKHDIPKIEDIHFCYLPKSFDVNVILSSIELLITDYSSVCYDAFYWNKPVLFYSPDFEEYNNNERGFLCDYLSVVDKFCAYDSDGLLVNIRRYVEDNGYKDKLVEHSIVQKNKAYDFEFSYYSICGKLFSNK